MADELALPCDEAIVSRALASGLECWHFRSRGSGFAVALAVDAGALDEEDGEEGIAHFLEHLAFQGGGSRASLRLRRRLEKEGSRLGRNLNATTGLEQTCYLFTVPSGGRDLLRRCLGALAEIAFGLELDPACIERERRVILEEMPLYEGETRRLRELALARLCGENRLARRHPLGLPGTVARVGAREIAAFHRRCYRPASARLLIASAQPPAAVAQLAEAAFGGWSAGARPPRVAFRGLEASGEGTDVFRSRGEERALRFYSSIAEDRPAGIAGWQARMAREAALWLFNRRLELVARRRSALAGARLASDRLTAELSLTLLQAGDLQQASWRSAIGALAGLARKTSAAGFSASELEEARRALDRRAAATSSTSPALLEPPAAIGRLIQGAAEGRPPMSAGQRARLLGEAAAQLDGEQLREGFRRLRVAEDLMIAVLPRGGRAPSRRSLEEWRRAAAAPPLPEARPSRPRPRRRQADLSVAERFHTSEPSFETWHLANGIRFHAMPKEPAERLSFALSLGAGRIEEATLPPGSTVAACWRLLQPMRFPELRRLIEENDLRCQAEVEDDAISLQLSAPAEGAEAALELIHHLLLPAPPSAAEIASWRRSVSGSGPRGVAEQLALAALSLLSSGDRRFRPAERHEIATLDRAAIGNRRREILGRPLEVALAGALPESGLAAAVGRWLGSLPARPSGDPFAEELRHLPAWQGPLETRLRLPADEEQAGLLCGWRGPHWTDKAARRQMHLATHVLEKRLFEKVRLKESLTYALAVAFSPSKAYPAASLLAASLLARPAHLERCRQLIEQEVAELRRRGPTEDERQAATRHFAQSARRALENPRFWARTLAEQSVRGTDLEELSRLPHLFAEVTRDQIAETLDRHLAPQNQLTVSCT